MEYAIVIEQTPRNFSAFAPDLPGCVATGATRDEVIAEMRAAIAFHIESLRNTANPCRRRAAPPPSWPCLPPVDAPIRRRCGLPSREEDR